MYRKSLLLASFVMALYQPIAIAQQKSSNQPEMIFINGGTFNMGSNTGGSDEKPMHEVFVDNFSICKYEVTIGEFRRFVKDTKYVTDAEKLAELYKTDLSQTKARPGKNWHSISIGVEIPEKDSMLPVSFISWNDANAYCDWLSKQTSKTYRIPTAAEWEFAARGGTKSGHFIYSGSNIAEEVAWFSKNAGFKSHNIGTKRANELGIYDMSGNMQEWCYDWYNAYYYTDSPKENPRGPDQGRRKVVRGGSWGSAETSLRTTYRNNDFPNSSQADFGFRLARTETPAPKVTAPVKDESAMKKELDSKGFINIYGIYFDPGSAKVKAESTPVIHELTEFLNEEIKVSIVIEGHTDNTGTADGNLKLSMKRAEAIRDALVERGIEDKRIQCKGLGDTQPIAENKTSDGRKQNRRVTIKKLSDTK